MEPPLTHSILDPPLLQARMKNALCVVMGVGAYIRNSIGGGIGWYWVKFNETRGVLPLGISCSALDLSGGG